MALRLAEDHDRIAAGLNDIVVYRLFSAGLDLDAALGLISEHRASAKIQHAISELDLAIRDIRDVVFDHRQSLWSGDLADRGRHVLGPHHQR
jgi:signal transduction histidine kinase